MNLRLPLNRFITLIKPYINVAAGAIAAWLVAKANILGIPGLGSHQNEIATGIAAAGVALVTWGAAQFGDLKWLTGHHIELEGVAATAAATATAAASSATTFATPLEAAPDAHLQEQEVTIDAGVEEVPHTELPSDQEEFMNPPEMPVQPSQSGLAGVR